MKRTSNFFVLVLRIALQIVGTYFVGKWTIEKIETIPASTWGWMALTVLIVIGLVLVWGNTIVGAFRGNHSERD